MSDPEGKTQWEWDSLLQAHFPIDDASVGDDEGSAESRSLAGKTIRYVTLSGHGVEREIYNPHHLEIQVAEEAAADYLDAFPYNKEEWPLRLELFDGDQSLGRFEVNVSFHPVFHVDRLPGA